MSTPQSEHNDADFEALVLRRLRGELDSAAAARLAALLASDPAWPRRAAQLERTWLALELPRLREVPVAPLLLARLRGDELRWSLAPTWARATAALALVAGLGAGWSLGLGLERPLSEAELGAATTTAAVAPPASAASAPTSPATAPASAPASAPAAATVATSRPTPAPAGPAAGSVVSAASASDLSDDELFGSNNGFGDPGFAESLWLAAEQGPAAADDPAAGGATP